MIDVTTDGAVATITLDDGKANAMNPDLFAAMNTALDQVEGDAAVTAVVIAGRPGVYSGGLDLKLLPSLTPEQILDLTLQFGRTMLRIWGLPKVVIGAATGHALGGGTVLALACDHTVAAEGAFNWGLNEVAIGMPVPHWIVALARGSVAPRHLDTYVLPGRVIDPEEAVFIGYADAVADPDDVVAAAQAQALFRSALATSAYAATKRALRGDIIDHELARIEPTMRALFGLARSG